MDTRNCASVKFSPDGKYLAVGLVETRSHSLKTYIIDVTTGRKIWSIRLFYFILILNHPDQLFMLVSQIGTLSEATLLVIYLSHLEMEDILLRRTGVQIQW